MMVAVTCLAQATKFTITTTLDDDNEEVSMINQSGRGQQECQSQIRQQMRQIRNCQRYLDIRSQQQQGGDDEMKIEVYAGVDQAPRLPWQEYQRRCCNVIQNMPEQCRCEAVRMGLRMQARQEQGGWQSQRMDQMRQLASSLPQECNVGQQQCRV
ncbi:OLC1v1033873C2 [Oldenlandia corymbosa var. corymbosa]|nr:OLC1v1033873C2 [Oldenlandia corymbosa var. corymbosa]